MKKKIIFIHHGGGVGGASTSMLQVISKLNKKLYEHLLVFTESGTMVDWARKAGFRIKVIPLNSAFFYSDHVKIRIRMLYRWITNYKSTINRVVALIKKEKPSLVYLNTSVLTTVAIAAKQENIPILWHVREVPGPNKFIRKWHVGLIKKLANQIIVNSDYVKKFYGVKSQVQTIHNAVDLEQFNINGEKTRQEIRSQFAIPVGSSVICMIGSVQKVKGHFLLVDVAKKLVDSKPGIRFLIVAGGVDKKYRNSWKGKLKKLLGISFDNMERMRKEISKNKLNEYFIFTGYRNDIAEILAASDIILFLSLQAEGFGRPLIEGMAAKKPIVATDIGPTKEILGETCGILVPVGDIVSTTEAIIRLIENPMICEELGKKGGRRIEKMFDLKQHAVLLEKYIEQTIN